MKRILMAVSPAMLDKMAACATHQDRTRSGLVREAIRQYLTKYGFWDPSALSFEPTPPPPAIVPFPTQTTQTTTEQLSATPQEQHGDTPTPIRRTAPTLLG